MPLEVRGDGITARVGVRAGPLAPVSPEPALPDVSRLPGASVVGVATDDREGVRVVLGCLRAPSDRWVPGLSSVVFERATPMILGAASMRPALERTSAAPVVGASFVEAHRGREGDRAARVVHAISFVGGGADVVACSLACTAKEDAACAAVASSLVIEGELVAEPAPGLVARAILGAAAHPVLAIAIGAAMAAAVIALLLVTRPRLRPTGRRLASRHRRDVS